MEQFGILPDAGLPQDLSGPEWALILVLSIGIRALPLLMLVGAIAKIRAFPALRPLHVLLLVELVLLAALATLEFGLSDLVPGTWRASDTWSFLWIFVIAWVAITWLRSAIKTRLRPRWIEWPTAGLAIVILIISGAAFLIPAGAP